MNILSIFSTEVIHALGWTLLHSLWQASLIGLLLFLILPLLKEKEANIRYHLAYAALLLVFAAALSTFLYYLTEDFQLQSNIILLSESDVISNSGYLTGNNTNLFQSIQENLDIIAFVWMLGMIFYFLKFGLGLYQIQMYKRQSAPISDITLNSVFNNLIQQFGVRRKIELRLSEDFSGPFVSGWINPIIFFPINLCCQLTPEQSKDILAHEIAHIMRHDFIINLIQVFIENLFYYHPVVWWISTTIRKEREIACDEFAIQASGYDRVHYANSLLSLGQFTNKRAPNLSLSAKGHKNDLFNRISNLLGEKQVSNQMKEKVIASVLMLGVTLIILGFRAPAEIISLIHTQDEIEEIVIIDTIPSVNESHSKIIELKNGKIQRLEIDGQEIPEEEYDTYDIIIEELSMPSEEEERHYEIITRLSNEMLEHFDSIPGMTQDLDFDLEELKEMALGLEDDFVILFDSIDSNVQHFDFKFDFDSLQQNFNMHHFDKEKLHEHLEMNKAHLNRLFDQSKEHYEFIIKENEWIDLEKLHLQMEGLKEHQWNDEEWKTQKEILKEKFKEFGEEGRLKLDELQWHLESPSKKRFGENEFYFMTPDMHFFPSSSFEDKIFHQLKLDGYIKEGLNTVIITGKSMKINGKKVDDASYERYKHKFENQLGGEMDKHSKIKIKRYFNQERNATTI